MFHRQKKNDGKPEGSESVGIELARVLPVSNQPWYKQAYLVRLNLLLMVPLLSSATGGYDGSMMNAQQVIPTWRSFFDSPKGGKLGLINAIFYVGKVSALPLVTFLSDRVGRRKPILLGLILCIVGTVLQTAAVNFAMLVVSRFVLGAATAFMAQPSPLLVTELAFPTHRGKITALYQTFFYFGAILSAWASFGTVRVPNDWAWRGPAALQAFFPVIQLCFWFWLPESPRWLLANERAEEALSILVKHHGNGDVNSPLVQFEMKEIQETIRIERELNAQSQWKDLIATPANRRRSAIAVSLGFFSQWCGNGVVSYYLTLVLTSVGITSPTHQALINGVLQLFNFFVSVFLGAFMVDRLGRRFLFLWSATGMMLAYIAWTVLNAEFLKTRSSGVGIAVIPMIFFFYFHYGIAFTPLVFAYPAEIFPYRLRGLGLSLTMLSTYIALIFNLFVNPIAMASISWRYYILFCCINACIIVVVYFVYPETKGHSLEEIARVFEGDTAAVNLGGLKSVDGLTTTASHGEECQEKV